MSTKTVRFLGIVLAVLSFQGRSIAQGVNMLTFHGDQARLGWNSKEKILTHETVNAKGFGKIWDTHLDGQVYGSPLHISAMTLQGKTRDVIFAATERNSVYALDAETGDILWERKELAPPLDQVQFNQCNNIKPWHGITSTPVIDLATKTLYCCGITQPGIRQVYKVWALDITTGAVKPGWPVTVKGNYKGVAFDGGMLTQRGALNLVKGWLYIPFGSRCDVGEWRGWVIGLNINTPTEPQRAFTPSLTVEGGGIWGSGGVSADSDGNIFCVTGNAGINGLNLDKGGENVCESILKLKPEGSEIKFSKSPSDYYVPSNWKLLDAADVDMGGSSAILLPDIPGAKTPKMIVTCGKDGLIYLANRANLGGVGGELYKERLFGSPESEYHSNIKTTPAYFDAGSAGRYVFVAGDQKGPKSQAGMVGMKLVVGKDGKATLDMAWSLRQTMEQPGAPTVSSNGTKEGIVWVVEANKDGADNGPPGVLYAVNAITGKMLFTTKENPSRDVLGDARKFCCPTVANGKVFVGVHGVIAYGLLSHAKGEQR